MKHITSLFLLFLCISLTAQIPHHLDVDGDAKIIGRLDIHHIMDTASVFIGWKAGMLMTDFNPRRHSTIVGSMAGYHSFTGSDNSYFGEASGYFSRSGWHNSFFGTKSGYSNAYGQDNSFFGRHSGYSNTHGDDNVSFGSSAGYHNTTGDANVHLGYRAGTHVNGDGNVFIGHFAGPNDEDVTTTLNLSNRLYIHNDHAFRPLIYGEFDNEFVRIHGDISWQFQLENSQAASRWLLGVSDDDWNIGTGKFAISNDNNSNNAALVIDANGNVGIGDVTPSWPLDVSGRIRGTEVFCGAVNACSDVRFKREFTVLHSPLSLLNQLNGYYHFWKQDEFPEWDFPSHRAIGFKAQEVQKVLPELVSEMPDGMLAVDYSKMVPVLVEAIKELSTTVAEQNDRIAELEGLAQQGRQTATVEAKTP